MTDMTALLLGVVIGSTIALIGSILFYDRLVDFVDWCTKKRRKL